MIAAVVAMLGAYFAVLPYMDATDPVYVPVTDALLWAGLALTVGKCLRELFSEPGARNR